jgi:hypothetical protein
VHLPITIWSKVQEEGAKEGATKVKKVNRPWKPIGL